MDLFGFSDAADSDSGNDIFDLNAVINTPPAPLAVVLDNILDGDDLAMSPALAENANDLPIIPQLAPEVSIALAESGRLRENAQAANSSFHQYAAGSDAARALPGAGPHDHATLTVASHLQRSDPEANLSVDEHALAEPFAVPLGSYADDWTLGSSNAVLRNAPTIVTSNGLALNSFPHLIAPDGSNFLSAATTEALLANQDTNATADAAPLSSANEPAPMGSSAALARLASTAFFSPTFRGPANPLLQVGNDSLNIPTTGNIRADAGDGKKDNTAGALTQIANISSAPVTSSADHMAKKQGRAQPQRTSEKSKKKNGKKKASAGRASTLVPPAVQPGQDGNVAIAPRTAPTALQLPPNGNVLNTTGSTAPGSLLELFRPNRASVQTKPIDIAAAVRTARGDDDASGSLIGAGFGYRGQDKANQYPTKSQSQTQMPAMAKGAGRARKKVDRAARPVALLSPKMALAAAAKRAGPKRIAKKPTPSTSGPVAIVPGLGAAISPMPGADGGAQVGPRNAAGLQKQAMAPAVVGTQRGKKRGVGARRGGRKKSTSSTIAAARTNCVDPSTQAPNSSGTQEVSMGEQNGTVPSAIAGRNNASTRGRGGRKNRTVRKTGKAGQVAIQNLSLSAVSPASEIKTAPASPPIKSPLMKKQKMEMEPKPEPEPLPANYVPDPVLTATARELTWLLGKAMIHTTRIDPPNKKHPNAGDKMDEIGDNVYISGRLKEISRGLKAAILAQKMKEQVVLAKKARLLKERSAMLERRAALQVIRQSRGLPVSPTTPPVASKEDRSGGADRK